MLINVFTGHPFALHPASPARPGTVPYPIPTTTTSRCHPIRVPDSDPPDLSRGSWSIKECHGEKDKDMGQQEGQAGGQTWLEQEQQRQTAEHEPLKNSPWTMGPLVHQQSCGSRQTMQIYVKLDEVKESWTLFCV